MQIVLLGAPGSGKGTMAADLVRIFGLPHISTGDIFRQNIKDKTPLGLQASSFINSGALVPDDVTIAMVADRLAQPDCASGFMLDGFPRTVPQAEALTGILNNLGLPLTVVINLEVLESTIIERLSGRRVCTKCGRSYHMLDNKPKVEGICDDCGGDVIQRKDDAPETVQNRLSTYRAQTEPLISYYSSLGLLDNIDNEGEVGSSLNIVVDAIKTRAQRKT